MQINRDFHDMQLRNPFARRRPFLRHLLLPLGMVVLLPVLAGTAQAWSLPFFSRPEAAPTTPAAPPPEPQAEVREFSAAVRKMGRELTANFQGPDAPRDLLAEGLLICSFVELKKLSRTSSFGRVLAEQLMSEFQQQGFRVVELRQSESILMQEQRGEIGLSRDPGEIREEVQSGARLTGTYTITGDGILVSARILDHRTAVLLASATAIFPRNDVTEALLADRVSLAGEGAKEVLYLKRLEM